MGAGGAHNTAWVKNLLSYLDTYQVHVRLMTLTYGSATTMPVNAVAQWLEKFQLAIAQKQIVKFPSLSRRQLVAHLIHNPLVPHL